MRSRTTFQKRQKELARQEKQRDKIARRQERKMQKDSPEGDMAPAQGEDELLEPYDPSQADAH